MHFVDIHDAKINLSKYLDQIVMTREPIIICKNGQPIAQLTEYHKNPDRKLGLWAGKITIADDFNNLPEDFESFDY